MIMVALLERYFYAIVIIPEGIRGDDNLPEGDGRTERGEKNI